jgi:hypothetical protein
MTTNSDNYEEDGAIQYPVFTAEVVDEITGGWGSVEVAIMQQDEKDGPKKNLGTFKRNYSTNFRNFAYCQKFGRYFALYSPHYTSTRVMEIFPGQGWKDIGGEDKDSNGFCPTEFYIPELREYVSEEFHCGPTRKIKDWSKLMDYFPPGSRFVDRGKSKGRQMLHYPDGSRIRAYTEDLKGKSWDHKWVYGPEREFESGFMLHPPKHAFVSGCYWGDDSSWKIQYLDVSRIDEGIIKRDERFGYIVLPENLSLKNAIQIEDMDENDGRINISIQLNWDLETGALMDWNGLQKSIDKGRPRMEETEESIRKWDHKAHEEDLRRRWAEQGERITAEVKAMGGEMR